MKKLLFIILLLGSVSVKGQDTIHIPTYVAKQIAKDLVSGDSAIALLGLTTEQLTLTEQKVVLKDSIISNYIKKDSLYEARIKNHETISNLQKQYISDLQKINKKLKVKLTFTKVVLGAIIGTLGYLYITK